MLTSLSTSSVLPTPQRAEAFAVSASSSGPAATGLPVGSPAPAAPIAAPALIGSGSMAANPSSPPSSPTLTPSSRSASTDTVTLGGSPSLGLSGFSNAASNGISSYGPSGAKPGVISSGGSTSAQDAVISLLGAPSTSETGAVGQTGEAGDVKGQSADTALQLPGQGSTVQDPGDPQQAQQLANKANAYLERQGNLSMGFDLDDNNRVRSFQIIDKTTNEVVMQYPSEAMLALRDRLDAMEKAKQAQQAASAPGIISGKGNSALGVLLSTKA